jgi:protein STE50
MGSPTLGSMPSTPILEWQEEDVSSLFGSLGFGGYHQQLVDNGITGEILVHLDHEALRDVGVHSVVSRG